MVMGELTLDTEVLVIGGGPGGYAAAFRAADLGMDVTMVDMAERPGGECLFRGCIPSKTLLHLAEILHDARRAESMGITFPEPDIDIGKIREHKNKVIDQLANGLVSLSEKRGIQRIKGKAVFESSNKARIYESDTGHIRFKQAIIATGSSAVGLPGTEFKKNGRIINSSGALELPDIPGSMLIVGGGYVGLEIGSVYAALGSRIVLLERGKQLMTGVDPDIVKPLRSRLEGLFEKIHYNTSIESLREEETEVVASFNTESGLEDRSFDRVLVAIGREPNSMDIGLENTKLTVDDKGFIQVDKQMRTSDPNIYAVGDVVGGYMLAHKAHREGKVAAEAIAGKPTVFDARVIPAIVFTLPQVAWCGLTEEQALKEDRRIKVQRFFWQHSGRAVTMDAPEGLTKMIIDPDTERIEGAGFSGRDTEGLIAEAVLAIEMGALVQDIALTVHAHPTLSETEAEVAEIFLGSATHFLSREVKGGQVKR